MLSFLVNAKILAPRWAMAAVLERHSYEDVCCSCWRTSPRMHPCRGRETVLDEPWHLGTLPLKHLTGPPALLFHFCVMICYSFLCIYIYTYIYTHIYIYIHTYMCNIYKGEQYIVEFGSGIWGEPFYV